VSHFAILVVTDEKPTDAVLKKHLQPFHDFESTGEKDDHVVFVDHTDEVRREWENETKTGFRGPNGKVYEGYEDEIFYRLATPEEIQKIGPVGGMGNAGGISYHTVYDHEYLLVHDPALQNALTVTGSGDGPRIPRGYRLASEDEKAKIEAALEAAEEAAGDDEFERPENGEVEGLRYRFLKQRLSKVEVRVREVPVGYVEEEFPLSQFYKSLAAYAKDYRGYDVHEDGRIGQETNAEKWLWVDASGRELGRSIGSEPPPGIREVPLLADGEQAEDDAPSKKPVYVSDDPEARAPIGRILIGGSKWDWWVVGGRWAHSLLVRPGAAFQTLMEQAGAVRPNRRGGVDQERVKGVIEAAEEARREGRLSDTEVRGLMAALKRHGVEKPQITKDRDALLKVKPPAKPKATKADSCQIRDLDLAALREEAVKGAEARYDFFESIAKGRALPHFKTGRALPHFKTILKECGDDAEKARGIFWNTPVIKDLMETRKFSPFNIDSYRVTREEFVRRAERDAFVFHAVLKDGRWYEAGQMGWWGAVHDEKDEDVWATQFNALMESLPPDTFITVIDCHI
jgi:hypothetical protein